MACFEYQELLLISIIFSSLLHVVLPYYQYPSVFWTPNNCRFNLNKGEHAYEFKVKPFGKVSFLCPNIALLNDVIAMGPQMSMMYENLMLVDKEGYDTCTVNRTRNPRLNQLILKCDGDARRLRFNTEIFAPQLAVEHKRKYFSGMTYYFIATSNGTKESLDNLSGGHCKTHNMKLKITVCNDNDRCPFIQPKCPYSIEVKDTPKSSVAPTTNPMRITTTVSLTTPVTTQSRLSSNSPPSSAPTPTGKREILKRKIEQTTESHAPAAAAKLSSNDSMWGAPKTHVIIHITMSLVIMVLLLSLIYVLITRRKTKSNPTSFSSRLYQERPTSAVPLEFNRDSSFL